MRRWMTRGSAVVWAVAFLAGAARAQSPDNPSFVFGLSTGALQGGGLWAIDRQTANVAPAGVDTLALGRRLVRPSAVIALSGTYYRSPHLGYTLEAGFLGLETRSSCQVVGGFAPDTDRVNAQACSTLNGSRTRTSAVTFEGGLTFRAGGPDAHIYLRAIGGVALLGESFVRAAGVAVATVPFQDSLFTRALVNRVFLDDAGGHTVTWTASLGVGATVRVAPGMLLGLQASDQMIALPVPTGPGDPARDPQRILPLAPVAWRTLHLPTLTVVLELLLERESRRRY